jgi:CRP-like cAMP-binding protein
MPANADLPPELEQRLQEIGSRLDLARGQPLLRRGEAGTALYLVSAGELEVRTPSGERRSVGPGGIVGEMAFLDHRPRSADVTALTPSVLIAVERLVALQRLSDHPLLLEELLRRLRFLQRQRLQDALPPDPRDPQAFAGVLVEEALRHRAVRHPFLRSLTSDGPAATTAGLRNLGRHYYGFVAEGPLQLALLLSRLEAAAHRREVLVALRELAGEYGEERLAHLEAAGIAPESIAGIPHPELLRRWRRTLGVESDQVAQDHPEVTAWREGFLDLLGRGSPAEAVGALGPGNFAVLAASHASVLAAIDRSGAGSGEAGAYFRLTSQPDAAASTALRRLTAAFAASPEGRRDLRRGMLRALALRDSFWSWLHGGEGEGGDP